MNLDRALKTQNQLVTQMRDLASRARCYGMTSEALIKAYGELLDRLPRGTPRHVREFARGYWQHINDAFHENDLVYGGIVEHKFYSVNSTRDDYYGKAGIDASVWMDIATMRGFYWKHKPLRPFFIG